MYEFTVKSDDEETIKHYINAISMRFKIEEIYNTARNYDKHIEPTEENYYKLCDEIKELSYLE